MDTQVYEALVLAVLSVNSYPLEKAWEMRLAIEKAGLFNPATLASLGEEDIAERLRQAGYDRGRFLTDLIASRLQSVGRYLMGYGLERVTRTLASGSTDEVQALLIKAKGIGPTVVKSFLLLRPEAQREIADDRDGTKKARV